MDTALHITVVKMVIVFVLFANKLFVLKKIVLLQTFLKNDNYGKVF